MKILVYTASHPSQKNLRIRYVEAILKVLKQKTTAKIIWVVCQPNRIQTSESDDYSIHDIHEFENAIDLLSTLKPNLVMGSVGIEPIQYSFGIAAKFLKIPLISFLSVSIIFETLSLPNRYKQSFRRMLSSNVSTDSSDEGQTLKRFRFFLYKLNFLQKTKISIKMNPLKFVFGTLQDFPSQASLRHLRPNKISDLYLAHHENQKSNIIKNSISADKVIVVGHPLLDIIHEKYVKLNLNFQNNSDSKILIVTDSLFEHGLWTRQKRNLFLRNLFTTLSKNHFQFDIKIHPASENIEYYEKLLNDLKIAAQIFQEEDLWELISDYNLVLSYGYSTSHTEISYAGMKMILLDPEIVLPKLPLVNEGIKSGHIQECSKIEELPNQIENFLKHDIILDEKFIQARNKLFFKFDGKSAERISNAIINLLSIN